MASRLCTLVLVASLSLAAGTAAAQQGNDSYQPILTDPGDFAAAIVTPGGRYAPFLGGQRMIAVGLRVADAAPTRAGYLSVQAGTARCAASASRARGQRFGRIELHGGRVVTAQLGYLRLTKPGPVRVCLWMTTHPTRRTRAHTRVIAVLGELFGGAAAHNGVLAEGPLFNGFQTAAEATFPVESTDTEAGTNAPHQAGCTTSTTTQPAGTAPDDLTGLYSGGRASTAGGFPCADTVSTFTYTRLGGVPLGSLSFHDPDRRADPDAAPVYHFGACELGAGAYGRAPYEAAAYIKAVGCVPGKVRPAPASYPGAPDGSVAYYLIDGARGSLAPAGSRVDMATNGVSASHLVDPSPLLKGVLARYAQGQRSGEQSLVTYDGPVLRASPGVVLLRFFIPSSSAAGGMLKGDDRGFTTDPNASFRAALLWDTSNGRVSFRITRSCRKGARGYVFDPYHKCRAALPLQQADRLNVFAHSDSRRKTNVLGVSADGATLHITLSILNSYTNGLPGRLGAWSVDNDITVTPTSLHIAGNGYPDIEAYFLPDGAAAAPQTIGLRQIETPHVQGVPGISLDAGGGDAAYDGASWAECDANPAARTTVCQDEHNAKRTWTTTW